MFLGRERPLVDISVSASVRGTLKESSRAFGYGTLGAVIVSQMGCWMELESVTAPSPLYYHSSPLPDVCSTLKHDLGSWVPYLSAQGLRAQK